MKKLILLVLLNLIYLNGFSIELLEDYKFDDVNDSIEYRSRLTKTIQMIINGEEIGSNQIKNSIPESGDEYSIYYSFTTKNDSVSYAFYQLDKKIFESVKKDTSDIFESYLMLSQFVDGDYAESYFDHIDFLLNNYGDRFCQTISKIPTEKVLRLLSDYEKICVPNPPKRRIN
jgi:hypothetical protein